MELLIVLILVVLGVKAIIWSADAAIMASLSKEEKAKEKAYIDRVFNGSDKNEGFLAFIEKQEKDDTK